MLDKVVGIAGVEASTAFEALVDIVDFQGLLTGVIVLH